MPMTSFPARSRRSFLTILTLASLASACSSGYKPCTQAGELRWKSDEPRKGTMRCQQGDSPTGQRINHGAFTQFFPDGKRAQLEGEFKNGKMSGLWVEYNPKGERIQERYFENGVERPIPLKPEVEPAAASKPRR